MPLSNSNADRPVAIAVEFRGDERGTYWGVSDGNRRWSIIPIVTGWRLEFRDPGDRVATYAGSHRTLQAARIEAARTVSLPSPQSQSRRSGIASLPHEDRDAPAATAAGQPSAGRPTTGQPGAGRPSAGRGLRAAQTTRRAERGRRRGDDRRQHEDDRRRGVDRRCRDDGFQHGDDRRRGNDRRGSDPAAGRAPAL